MEKILLGMFLILTMGIATATSVGTSEINDGKVKYVNPNIPTNFTKYNVSQADFWDLLDTPLDIEYSDVGGNAWWDGDIDIGTYDFTTTGDGTFSDILSSGVGVSVDVDNRLLYDLATKLSIDYNDRILYAPNGITTQLDWSFVDGVSIPGKIFGTIGELDMGADPWTLNVDLDLGGTGTLTADALIGAIGTLSTGVDPWTLDTGFQATAFHLDDNNKFCWGSADDGCMKYDGRDLVLNPKEVGNGGLKIMGNTTTYLTGYFGGGVEINDTLAETGKALSSGTGSVTGSGTTITGSGTLFLTQVHLGDRVYMSSGSDRVVIAIASDTSLTTDLAWNDATPRTFQIYHTLATIRKSDGTIAMTISDEGNVGLGSFSPKMMFDLASLKNPNDGLGTYGNYPMMTRYNSATNGKGTGIAFGVSTAVDTFGGSLVFTRDGSSSYGHFDLDTVDAGGNWYSRLRVSDKQVNVTTGDLNYNKYGNVAYTNGEASVCIYNNGTMFVRDGGCN